LQPNVLFYLQPLFLLKIHWGSGRWNYKTQFLCSLLKKCSYSCFLLWTFYDFPCN